MNGYKVQHDKLLNVMRDKRLTSHLMQLIETVWQEQLAAVRIAGKTPD